MTAYTTTNTTYNSSTGQYEINTALAKGDTVTGATSDTNTVFEATQGITTTGNSTIGVTNATLYIDGAVSGNNVITFNVSDAIIYWGATSISTGGHGATVSFAPNTDNTFVITEGSSLSGLTITGFEAGDSLAVVDSNGNTVPITGVSGSGPTYNLTLEDGSVISGVTLTGPNGSNLGTLTVGPDGTLVCFAEGTLIATPQGEVPVETLKVGDMVLTSSGTVRPVIWIGSRTVTPDPRRGDMLPVRIAAGAFGEGRPHTDLFVSPDHAVCVSVVDEVLIPARYLVNGASVAPVKMETVTYYHVELENHEVLLANGLPAESYLDCDNRGWFDGRLRVPNPNWTSTVLEKLARPLLQGGPKVAAVRAHLSDSLADAGWTRTHDMGVHLEVDGQRIDADDSVGGGLLRFLFPASARSVRLVSATYHPSVDGVNGDVRQLGIPVTGLTITDALRTVIDGLQAETSIPLDLPALGKGFHQVEPGVRWTDGAAELSPSLWAGCRSLVMLHVSFVQGAAWRWVRPEGSVEAPLPVSNVVALRDIQAA